MNSNLCSRFPLFSPPTPLHHLLVLFHLSKVKSWCRRLSRGVQQHVHLITSEQALGLAWGLPLPGCAWKTYKGRRPGGILIRCLNHFSVLLSTQRSTGCFPGSLWMCELLTICKPQTTHPKEETWSSHLSHIFHHCPELMAKSFFN